MASTSTSSDTKNIEPNSNAKPASHAKLTNDLLVIWALAHRELVRFFRQRNRVIGALGQPLLFWILFGAGLGPSFRLPNEDGVSTALAMSYQEYFFPGTVVLILLFTAIFSTISIIEDRKEGIFQSVLVAPISRYAMVIGKLLGGTLIAFIQAMIFLALGWWTLGLSLSLFNVMAVAGLSFVIAFALCGLGFLMAWKMDSTQGFHAMMTLFLMPMWLLSGAFFPASDGWLGWIIRLNPLTYCVAAFRRLLYWGNEAVVLPASLPTMSLSLFITGAFAALMFVSCCWMAAKRSSGDLV